MSKKFNKKDLTQDEILYLRAKEAYYNGNPLISDTDFDVLELKLENEDSIVIGVVGSLKETKTGFSFSKGKIKFVTHDIPMGSLDKVKFLEDYTPFVEFQNKFLNRSNDDCLIEVGPKLDGNAGSLKYVNGKLAHIASRGDGIEGQDYTHLPLNVPQYIPGFSGEIRGEFVIDIHLFNAKYAKDFANARNFVAGSLAKGEKDRVQDIDFVAFRIEGFDGNDNETIRELRRYGFDTLTYTETVKKSELTQAKFEELYTKFEDYRENKSNYQLDGFVFKYPESMRDEIGGNSHHPFWAVAVKFIPEEVSTQTVGIEWTLGKRGQLTPVAVLEAVQLMGSVVQRASMYNASWMLNNKCTPGATVALVKSGDIIPKIVEVMVESTEDYELPTEWNGHELEYDGVNLVVKDFESTDEYKELMMHHSIETLGIKHVGPSHAARIAKAGLTIEDLFWKHPDEIVETLIKSGEYKKGRELEKLINNILEVTEVSLADVIRSFGYRNLGRSVSEQLARFHVGMKTDFSGLERSVVEAYVNSQERQDEVSNFVSILRQNNIDVIEPKDTKSLITFEMSGDNFSGETKGRFKARMEQSNKAVHTTLKKDTDYLVVGSLTLTTSKMKKAEKNGTKIVTYEQFEKLILE